MTIKAPSDFKLDLQIINVAEDFEGHINNIRAYIAKVAGELEHHDLADEMEQLAENLQSMQDDIQERADAYSEGE
jgi:hypothetical protein